MEAHWNLTDQQFTHQFANGSLEPSLFTHQAHLRLAWIRLGQLGVAQAAHLITKEIKAFATLHGDPEKYHHTLTIAAIQVVHHFMNKSEAKTFQELIAEYPVLIQSFKSLILSHYTPELIFSDYAKQHYSTPDLLDFDYPIENQLNIG